MRAHLRPNDVIVRSGVNRLIAVITETSFTRANETRKEIAKMGVKTAQSSLGGALTLDLAASLVVPSDGRATLTELFAANQRDFRGAGPDAPNIVH